MTVLALRYDTRPGRFRSGHRGGTGFVRDARAARRQRPMDESRTIKLQMLQERIARDEYVVDVNKVAEAILARFSSPRDDPEPSRD
jgi:hypothetical protein